MREKVMASEAVAVMDAAVTEGERSEPVGAGASMVDREPDRPEPEVSDKPVRRRFTVAYKARIVREAEACTEYGQIGALLRREGLYSSQLSSWRRAMRDGALVGLRRKRGRKVKPDVQLRDELKRVKRDKARLERQLQQAETVIEVQKKLSEMLGIPLEPVEPEEDS